MINTEKPWILAIALAASVLLSACAPAAAPAAKPTAKPAEAKPAPTLVGATPRPAADQPRYGGTLTLLNSGDPGHLDAQRLRGIVLHAVVAPGYSQILQWDSKDPQKIAPDLAGRWEVTPDGKAYTFYLRKDVQWHDGKPFTSADAKFSIERLGEKGSPFATMFLAVDKTEAPIPTPSRSF
ncbi:MAG: hypothetical protein HYX92_14405 [Chloroflexi bacterium]|nr:hypothetical protein [Chloroflexota bacterium]